ncbi:putative hydrolase [Hyaloraphidium curvatum]|nr:putative hydrolase [Hyaloraphidium curvatum]
MPLSPKPFTIAVPDAKLDRLKQKLELTDWPDASIPDELAGWEYGIPTSVVKKLAEAWKSYDWRRAERELNAHPHFKAEANGIDVHFIHKPSAKKDAVPLLLIHGWPGSFYEFHELIPKLEDYHVVVPSLPGYGFSSAPKVKGFGIRQMAKTLNELMVGLGYTKYVSQGGDWGAIISQCLGAFHHENCRAIHLNMVIVPPPSPETIAADMPGFTDAEKKMLGAMQHFAEEETGYQRIQQTKPQTLGHGLSDSPVGVLAWIAEKFHGWTDLRGEKDFPPTISTDRLLTNVMIYYVNNAITSSTRLYYETMKHDFGTFLAAAYAPTLPVGIAMFPKEIYGAPKKWAERTFPGLVRYEPFENGGHFAAMEEPEVLLGEVLAFLGTEEVKKALA